MIGKTVGHYKISEPLGAGGMGVVYRAQDLKLGRMVALKVLPAGAGATEEATERFKREARTASSLNHPNICTIYGFDEHEGQLYMAMELLDGEPLDKRMAGRPLDLNQVLDMASQDLRCHGRRTRERHSASRHQAGQHLHHAPWHGESARLRSRQALTRLPGIEPACRRVARDRGPRALHQHGRHHGRHHCLHVARAGTCRGRGLQNRPVLIWCRALRNDHGPPEFSWQQHGGRLRRDSESRSGAAKLESIPACLPNWTASSGKLSRRIERCAIKQQPIWAPTSSVFAAIPVHAG